jgi:hypothetical protein
MIKGYGMERDMTMIELNPTQHYINDNDMKIYMSCDPRID